MNKAALTGFALGLSVFLSHAGFAQEITDAPLAEEPQEGPALFWPDKDVAIETFLWTHRPIVVFADSPADPRFIQQIELLTAEQDSLLERDVVVLIDTDPSATSPLRQKLRPRGFAMVLIGKDGGVKLRKPLPWNVREISRVIDKMPMRQQEISDRRGDG